METDGCMVFSAIHPGICWRGVRAMALIQVQNLTFAYDGSYDNIFELATIPEDVVKKNSILKKYINL